MTLADRLAARLLAHAARCDADCCGDSCIDTCFLARAVLAFVPGEVEAPGIWEVAVDEFTENGNKCVVFSSAGYDLDDDALTPAEAVALGHALVLAGMEADRG